MLLCRIEDLGSHSLEADDVAELKYQQAEPQHNLSPLSNSVHEVQFFLVS